MKRSMNAGFRADSPRPEEEISFDVSVCSAEFPEGCKKPANEELDSIA